ncbi:hypothetical protein BSL78_11109 [Apostichopus japonicus]|uniref:Uncharacterized protein n=1 Tax=Stichopus japonicus TaxID=307972 RepID=A0A2G8KVG4_STIJA|nr:hypothetical protein BSL78_11109 [Apostichopus japonicus]
MQRLREKSLTLNGDKCEFNKSSVEFFGHIFSSSGVSPSPTKVQSLIEVPPPCNREEVRSFLGLANYCARFIPYLASLSEPLRDLTRQSVPWPWEERHAKSFNDIKHAIAQHCHMAYFDSRLHSTVVVDASPVGLCAMLVQGSDRSNKIVALASRSLTAVEKRYSQTEREALAVTWGITHFYLYLYGSKFTVITDHKPLVPLFNRSNSSPPARIERWMLHLQQYDFSLDYQPGATNPADYLSRHPLASTSTVEPNAEVHINFIVENAVPKSINMDEIVAATTLDPVLQACIKAVEGNSWYSITPELQCFKNVKNELSVAKDGKVLLCDHRIVIPSILRDRIITIAHQGHQGVVRTKQLIREKVWFPGIDKRVEEKISQCIPCQATSSSTTREPIQMSALPTHPWKESA